VRTMCNRPGTFSLYWQWNYSYLEQCS